MIQQLFQKLRWISYEKQILAMLNSYGINFINLQLIYKIE